MNDDTLSQDGVLRKTLLVEVRVSDAEIANFTGKYEERYGEEEGIDTILQHVFRMGEQAFFLNETPGLEPIRRVADVVATPCFYCGKAIGGKGEYVEVHGPEGLAHWRCRRKATQIAK